MADKAARCHSGSLWQAVSTHGRLHSLPEEEEELGSLLEASRSWNLPGLGLLAFSLSSLTNHGIKDQDRSEGAKVSGFQK